MSKDIRLCECHGRMYELGAIGREVQILDENDKLIGVKPILLYQCEECKKVELE